MRRGRRTAVVMLLVLVFGGNVFAGGAAPTAADVEAIVGERQESVAPEVAETSAGSDPAAGHDGLAVPSDIAEQDGAVDAAVAAGERSPLIIEGDLGRELDTLLNRLVRWGFHGSVLVARDGAVVLQKGYGLAVRAPAVANTPDTLYEIASVTKHLTAAAVLLLEQDGALSTDDSIARWLPGVPEEHAGVTIYHLLTHTSGFPRMGPTGTGADMTAAVRDYLAGGRVRAPGEGFEYWNGGYALLAMIIERASGKSYQEVCRERMFRPAGMTSTGFCQETFDATRLAHGHVDDQDMGPGSSHSYGWEYKGMGGVVTSVVDLYRWDRAMRGGALLQDPAAKLERAFRSGYGGGTWVETTSRGTRLLTIGGNVTGFNHMVWRLPDDDTVVIVLCNTPQYALPVGMHALRRLLDLPGFVSMPPEVAELDQEQIERMCGVFRGEAGTLEIRPGAGNEVEISVNGQPLVQLFMRGSTDVPEPLQEQIAVAERVLRGATEGDLGPLRELMAPEIPADWPERFGAYWNDRIAEHGAVVSYELLGARSTTMGPASLRVLYRLHHERAEALAALTLMGDRLLAFILDVEGAVVEYTYVPTSTTTLGSYSIGPGGLPVVEIVESGDAVVRSGSGATITLVRE